MRRPVVRFRGRTYAALTKRDLYDLLCLRDEVFVVGQGITAEAEADGKDPECLHVVGRDAKGRAVATARLFLRERPIVVGRIAVHPSLQRKGVGTLLMAFVHRLLAGRAAEMSAQAHLRPWYERLGWKAVGRVYDEAGIPHVRMVRAPRTRDERATGPSS
jgi:predicted GNAT family N-acyltransferase